MEKVNEEEIKRRIKRFQEYLEKNGISLAIILQNVDRYYFSGTIQLSTLLIPFSGDPVLIVHKGFERVKEESPLKEIIRARQTEVGNFIRGYLRERSRVGLEFDVIPANVYLRYKEMLKDFEIVDISEFIRKTRMIKSEYEITQIKKAVSIVDEGFKEVQKILRPGISELEVDAFLGYISRKKGHMGMMRMREWNQEMHYVHVLSGETGSVISFLNSPHGGKGITPAMAQGAGLKKIKEGEPIEIDYGACVNGYIADESRTFVIGDLPDRLKKAHECSLEIHRFFSEIAKPGIYCNEIYERCLEIAKEWGLEEYFMGYGEGKAKFVGHGIGLEIDEYPVITSRFKERLQEGMVIAFEPKFVFPKEGVVGLEDVYVIKKDGPERITKTEQKIIRIRKS